MLVWPPGGWEDETRETFVLLSVSHTNVFKQFRLSVFIYFSVASSLWCFILLFFLSGLVYRFVYLNSFYHSICLLSIILFCFYFIHSVYIDNSFCRVTVILSVILSFSFCHSFIVVFCHSVVIDFSIISWFYYLIPAILSVVLCLFYLSIILNSVVILSIVLFFLFCHYLSLFLSFHLCRFVIHAIILNSLSFYHSISCTLIIF